MTHRNMMSLKVILDEKLIECVRKQEVLYNSDLTDYSDNNFKVKIWKQIAKECGLASGEDAKKHWKNLRDSYRSAQKMYIKSKKKNPSKKIKTWRYFEKMQFLRPYMKDRQSTTNVGDEFSDDTQFFDENSEEKSHIIKEEAELFELALSEEELEGCSENDGFPSSSLASESRGDLEETSSEMHWNQPDLRLTSEDSLKLFFDSMCASTKKLSPALQRVVKSKVLQAVNDAEIAMEAKPQDRL